MRARREFLRTERYIYLSVVEASCMAKDYSHIPFVCRNYPDIPYSYSRIPLELTNAGDTMLTCLYSVHCDAEELADMTIFCSNLSVYLWTRPSHFLTIRSSFRQQLWSPLFCPTRPDLQQSESKRINDQGSSIATTTPSKLNKYLYCQVWSIIEVLVGK